MPRTQRLLILLVGLVGLMGGCLNARAAGPMGLIMGAGTESCGTWVQARQGRGPVPFGTQSLFVEWAEGYLSAVELWSPPKPTDGLDPGALETWLDNYCQTHPLTHFVDALDALIRSNAHR